MFDMNSGSFPLPQPLPQGREGLKALPLQSLHIPYQLMQYHSPTFLEAHLPMLLPNFFCWMASNRRIEGFALPDVFLFQPQNCGHKRLLSRFPAFGIAVGKNQLFTGIDFKKHAPVNHLLTTHLKHGVKPYSHAQIEVTVGYFVGSRNEGFLMCSGVVQHSHSRSRGVFTTRSSFKSV